MPRCTRYFSWKTTAGEQCALFTFSKLLSCRQAKWGMMQFHCKIHFLREGSEERNFEVKQKCLAVNEIRDADVDASFEVRKLQSFTLDTRCSFQLLCDFTNLSATIPIHTHTLSICYQKPIIDIDSFSQIFRSN